MEIMHVNLFPEEDYENIVVIYKITSFLVLKNLDNSV